MDPATRPFAESPRRAACLFGCWGPAALASRFEAGGFRLPGPWHLDRTHLSFREAEAVRQLLPFGAHHVVILLEGVFQP